MAASRLIAFCIICTVMVSSGRAADLVYAVTAGNPPGYQPGNVADPGYYADSVTGVAVDRRGSVWIVGNTYSQAFPDSVELMGPTPVSRYRSAFIGKLASDGSHLTYLKVIAGASAEGMAADAAGSVYVLGHGYIGDGQTPTLRLGVPSLGSSFLLKLDSTGQTVYLVYFDGQFAAVPPSRVAVDPLGQAYVITPGAIPVTAGAYASPVGYERTSIIKLNSTGSALVYVAQIPAYAAGVATDAAGAVYVAGTTASREFPTTPGAFQERIANSDSPWSTAAFVVKLNAAGTALVYSTYLGGSGWEPGNWVAESAAAIAVDANGSAYVTGRTFSPDFPATSRQFQTGAGAVFIAKLNSSGAALEYSTVFGGYLTSSNAIAVDARGNAFITGKTVDGLPLFRAPQPAYYGPQCQRYSNFGSLLGYIECGDAFVAGFNWSGADLLYSTYLNGSFFDSGNAIVADAGGNQYVGGSGSLTWPATKQFSSGGSAFVVKLTTAGTAPGSVRSPRRRR